MGSSILHPQKIIASLIFLNLISGNIDISKAAIDDVVQGSRFNWSPGIVCSFHQKVIDDLEDYGYCSLAFARTRAYQAMHAICPVFRIPLEPGSRHAPKALY